MEEMWAANQLSVSERNVLCDSMLAAAASGDPDLHTQASLHSPSDISLDIKDTVGQLSSSYIELHR
jgi:hypothetical protein